MARRERDAAIERAERAERERDAAMALAGQPCDGIGCPHAEKAERERDEARALAARTSAEYIGLGRTVKRLQKGRKP